MDGTDMKTIIINDIHDLDLEHVFECGQCFRWVPADDGTGSYIGAAGKYCARVSLENGDRTLKIEASGGDEAFWRHYFDLDTDYSSIKRELAEKEPGIIPAMEYGGGIRILNQDLYETIISFIISQNNNIPRIRKCIEAICGRYGGKIGSFFGREWHAFPEPEVLAAADPEDIMALRLGYRSKYIVESSKRFIEAPRPETRDGLLEYQGIGPKVANCILLFGLRRTDAFPIDTWVKHIMNDMYGFEENDVHGMAVFAEEKYGKLAGYAQQYLFYYYRSGKE